MNIELQKKLMKIMDNTRTWDFSTIETRLYVLTLFLIKSISEQSKESSSWNSIKENAINLGTRVDKALKNLENQNDFLKGIVEDIKFERFQKEGMNVDLLILITVIDSIDFEKYDVSSCTDNINELFDAREGAAAGQFTSPKRIGELLVGLLNQKGGELYDGTVGTGSFLIEQHKLDPTTKLFGQEISKDVWLLCKLNLLLHQVTDTVIKFGDTMKEPILESDELKKFDGILMEQPIGIKQLDHDIAKKDIFGRFKYGVPRNMFSETALLLHALSCLKTTGKAVIVIPQGFLFRGGAEQEIREGLLKDDVIETIISMPTNLYVGRGIGISIIVLNKNKEKDMKKKVHMIHAQDFFGKEKRMNFLRKEDADQILDIYHNRKQIENISNLVDMEEILSNQCNLVPNQYFSKKTIETELLGTVVVDKTIYEQTEIKKQNLENFVEVYRGYGQGEKIEGTHEIKIINIADITEDGIDFSNLKKIKIQDMKKVEKFLIAEGDLLLSCRGTAYKFAIVPEINEPIIISSNLIGIKAKTNTLPDYILLFLESPIGKYYLESIQKGTIIRVLNVNDLKTIPVPLLSKEEQEKIVEAYQKANEEYKKQLQAAKESLKNSHLSIYKEMGIKQSFEQEKGDD